ncbi:MAG TPA: hypothetical protein VH542_11905 [Steroidobacteraceae bacterium]|jgi:hypothetical protein
MKKFLAIYTGSATARKEWESLSADQRREREKAGIDAWMKWGETHKSDIADGGAPLGKTKRVSRDGITDIRNAMAGYTIVEAPSQEAAAKLFEKHPHFTIFPGDGVEVMECLPLPR